MKYFLSIFCFLICIYASQTNNGSIPENKVQYAPDGKLDKFQWLLGKWKMRTPKGTFYEIWEKDNDNLFNGKSVIESSQDTISSKKTLEIINGEVYYIPWERTKEGYKTNIYKLISEADNIFVFENDKIDFPKRITYLQPHPDSLLAIIEGINNGELTRKEYRMGK